jgi:hypothetical protein
VRNRRCPRNCKRQVLAYDPLMHPQREGGPHIRAVSQETCLSVIRTTASGGLEDVLKVVVLSAYALRAPFSLHQNK